MSDSAAWAEFALAFGVFLGAHRVPVLPSVRENLTKALGKTGFTVAYSVLSLVLLGWLIEAAAEAPYVSLWEPAVPLVHTTFLLMGFAFLLFGLAIARPNPFSFGGLNNEAFDPARPGIIRWLRHPMLAALALWAFGHLISNGDLAHVILFGSLGVFALLGMKLIDRRKKRVMGAEWDRLLKDIRAQSWNRGFVPFPAFVIRLLFGLGAMGGMLLLHPLLLGVDPLVYFGG
ncbi:NnrU family protein [Roseibium litorale]|uniref:NnrU family protein n=1 Tax=Roseibium litorale TaxID=2803841 RepID=A0ABR9CKT6_9HYPH|nr:NnrU family protein [Roseibium litorale]MBD8890951.1 NnrU family protein [Roseibium litorale]